MAASSPPYGHVTFCEGDSQRACFVGLHGGVEFSQKGLKIRIYEKPLSDRQMPDCGENIPRESDAYELPQHAFYGSLLSE